MKLADQLRHPSQRRSRVRGRAILAEFELKHGHLEAACATWNSALDEYPSISSGRVDQRMRTMFGLLRPHLSNATARDLHERARGLVPAGVVA